MTGRRVRWCSDPCRQWFYDNHIWTYAREAARKAAGRRCSVAGCKDRASLEVDHIRERKGMPMAVHSCLHHQENLRVLCHHHHVNRRSLDEELTRRG